MKLSIIVAAFNVELFIEKCIVSCIKQSMAPSDYEIIAVNDGSTDRTLEILLSLSGRCHNLKIINQANSGLGSSRNVGLNSSKGDYVWFIDGDDYLQENVLPEFLNHVYEKKLDTLVFNYSIVDNEYKVLQTSCNQLIDVNRIVSGSEYYQKNFSNSYTWLFVFRRSLFEENSISFMPRINMQDSEILPKIMFHCKRLLFLDMNVYYYVQHASSFTNSSNGEKRFKYFESIVTVEKSLLSFLSTTGKNDEKLKYGIEQKVKSLHKVAFFHLLFFKYDTNWFKSIVCLLREHDFYPFKIKLDGKLNLIKTVMNFYPYLVNRFVNYLRGSK